MTSQPTTEVVVRRSVSVPLAAEKAFELFTGRMTEFWPSEHSIGSAEIAEVVVEPREGGRWFERGVDGSECEWGRVAQWSPPGRLVLLWQINARWTYDPSLVTEVEVDFVEEAAGRTRLELAHRHLERYGEQAGMMRQVFGSPGGWAGTLNRFAALTG
ncbi:SRPBCC family protein [Streptomyces sp. NPDC006274]|uniref:SRPBCC family protein n=1 Tax=unclassified Streptomyces TaxID=2593676 RepID=UPI0033A524B7